MKPLGVVLFVVLGAVPVLAHHGVANFEMKTVEITGTVRQFQFTNPHSWIQVDVKDPATGKVVEWSLEWGSPNSLTREGVHPDSLPVGAKGTFVLHPAKTGQPFGSFVAVKFEDGRIVGKWNGSEGGGYGSH